MKSYIVRRTTQRRSLSHKQKSQQSEENLRASSIGSRVSSEASRTLLISKARGHTKSLTKPSRDLVPYENFVKDMKIKLPSPKEKFYQFLKIPPFNRVESHNQLICLFLKHVKFFKVHQPSLMKNMARKVRLLQPDDIPAKMMVIVLEGECMYKGQPYSTGQLLSRESFERDQLVVDPQVKLVAINKHEYLSFISTFIMEEMMTLKEFLNSIQVFKMFSQKTLQKFTQYASLHYFLKGQKLYKVGDEANSLFVVYSGRVSRGVVIEIEQANRIPHSRWQREVRILNKSYSHRIEFVREEILGVSELIDNVVTRKEQIDIDEDSVIMGIDRSIIQESMDDYVVDRLKKYNLKKYPSNYDQLCENYLKQKTQLRRVEQRKISALQSQLRGDHNPRRRQKIESIIRMYQSNIKKADSQNLLNRHLHYEQDANK